MFKSNTVNHPDGSEWDVVYDNGYGVVQYIKRVRERGSGGPPDFLHLVRLCHSKLDANYRDHVVSEVSGTVTLGLTAGSFRNAIRCAESGEMYSLFERQRGASDDVCN